MEKKLVPLSDEQSERLHKATEGLNAQQLAWLSGYFWGLSAAEGKDTPAPASSAAAKISLIVASQTGNAVKVGEWLNQQATEAGFTIQVYRAGEYKYKQIDKEEILFLITSTQGEGEPPEEAYALANFLKSKKAPRLEHLRYGVFGLGDSVYKNFCQAGKDFDRILAELGASRVVDRGDADIDYKAAAEAWIGRVVDFLKAELALPSGGASLGNSTLSTEAKSVSGKVYTREKPFPATVLLNQAITARGAEKEVRHLEIDLKGSGIVYRPGDALGIWHKNKPELVSEFIRIFQLDADETLLVEGVKRSLSDLLSEDYELSPYVFDEIRRHLQSSKANPASSLIADKKLKTKKSFSFTPELRPAPLSIKSLLPLLRPMSPRLYSIASSAEEVGEEVHITVGIVRYQLNGKEYEGAASGYLSRLQEDDTLRVFIEPNDRFRLPADPSVPIIMIGAGTGIAPYRAFMQEREATGAEGRNWLFFGNKHFISDFLYQTEWQQYVKSGLLNRIDLAWSRDGKEKEYVCHKILQQAEEVWKWLQEGAHVYVCGDAERMAKDVELALLQVIREQGGLAEEEAEEFINDLRFEKRYQRDVY